MEEEVYPLEQETRGKGFREVIPRLEEIRQRVREAGLWAPQVPTEYGGLGLSFMEHALVCEELAKTPYGMYVFNAQAPDAGNMEILNEFGTEAQKERWLRPLTAGEIRSCFAMTEPEHAGSNPVWMSTTAVKDGGDYVINGHKWFTSNGKRADFLIVMCRTADPEGSTERNAKMTQIIVPTDTPGLDIVRSVEVWGRDSDHCEILYDDVRVPLENQLGQTGSGHQAAQDRLGAGRVYHCMNSIGQMWRAFDLMLKRSIAREVHGGKLETKQFVQGFIADSYIDLQSARLMTIHCAERMEAGLDARTEISAIKIYVPLAYHRVVDRAIQVWGAAGVSGDLPLSAMYQGARTLRIADGPDEVHKILIAKNVLKQYHAGGSWDFGN